MISVDVVPRVSAGHQLIGIWGQSWPQQDNVTTIYYHFLVQFKLFGQSSRIARDTELQQTHVGNYKTQFCTAICNEGNIKRNPPWMGIVSHQLSYSHSLKILDHKMCGELRLGGLRRRCHQSTRWSLPFGCPRRIQEILLRDHRPTIIKSFHYHELNPPRP